ncbi:hypothetical protein [Streptomyces sp. NPDC051921]|uniref:hypothetical protein n=1 Tax=Streptomyces sp. NPDC051921 TaxID=3155806 RepID=UPI003413E997
MVSSPHEAMHRIFQHDLHLFSRLSELLGLPLPPPVEVTVLPNDLTEASPVERRVDTLLRLDSAEDGSLLLAIEAQGKKDPAKPASWAYYTAYLWTKYRLPTALLVVCQDRSTADWAGRPVTSGPPHIELWRNLVAVDLSFYKSVISEEIRDEGRAQGRAQGSADAILIVLEQRGLDVSDDARQRITGCADPEVLRRWVARAVTVSSAEEIFADEDE